MAPAVDASRRAPDVTVGMQRCRESFAEIVRRAQQGDYIAITYHGKIVAGLVSVDALESLAGQAEPKRPKPTRE